MSLSWTLRRGRNSTSNVRFSIYTDQSIKLGPELLVSKGLYFCINTVRHSDCSEYCKSEPQVLDVQIREFLQLKLKQEKADTNVIYYALTLKHLFCLFFQLDNKWMKNSNLSFYLWNKEKSLRKDLNLSISIVNLKLGKCYWEIYGFHTEIINSNLQSTKLIIHTSKEDVSTSSDNLLLNWVRVNLMNSSIDHMHTSAVLLKVIGGHFEDKFQLTEPVFKILNTKMLILNTIFENMEVLNDVDDAAIIHGTDSSIEIFHSIFKSNHAHLASVFAENCKIITEESIF